MGILGDFDKALFFFFAVFVGLLYNDDYNKNDKQHQNFLQIYLKSRPKSSYLIVCWKNKRFIQTGKDVGRQAYKTFLPFFVYSINYLIIYS